MSVFEIDPLILNVAPNLKLGILTAKVQNTSHNKELWQKISELVKTIEKKYAISQVNSIPQISAQRNAYRALGKDPSRYRGSAEALLRRVLQGKGLYKVNTIVDINNLISLKTLHPVGSYNLFQIKSPFIFGIGESGESYKGIGKAVVNIEKLPLFRDAEGPFGSPTSDSERALITNETNRIMMVVIAFSGGDLVKSLKNAEEMLKEYAMAEEVVQTIQ